MRLVKEDSTAIFAQGLLVMGKGQLQDGDVETIELPKVKFKNYGTTLDLYLAAISLIYGDIEAVRNCGTELYENYLQSRAIIAPLNAEAQHLNDNMCNILHGEVLFSKSIDQPNDQALDLLPLWNYSFEE